MGRSAVLRGGRGHEPETMEHFVRLAREASGTIFDIGANTGLFALVAASVNPEVSVHAFEAVPRTFERLVANVGLNPGLDVTAHPDAVARQSGTARLFVPHTGLPLDASLLAGYRDDVDVVEVTAVSVDDFVSVNRIERVALMKIDVEGTEDDVIAGALRTINRDRPTLICELLPARPPAERVPPLLRPLGYRFFHLRGSGAVEVTGPIAGYDGRDYNFLIRPPSR